MEPTDKDVYRIAVPEAWQQELVAAVRAEAEAAGKSGQYTLEFVDAREAASELQFDPLTVAIVVAKFALEAAAAFLVGAAVERLLKKMSAQRKLAGARIVVEYPDGELESIDASDPAAVADAIERLKQGAA